MCLRRRLITLVWLLLLSSSSALAATRMIFPRIIIQKGRWSGIAIVNPTSADAAITLTAYNSDGTPFAGDKVVNPAKGTVPAGGQFVGLSNSAAIFNPPASVVNGSQPTRLWVEVTSTTDGLTAFFLEGNDEITSLYGGDLGTFGTDLLLPAVENTGSSVTEISLINADIADANVTVDFLKADGTQAVPSQGAKISKLGALQGPLEGFFSIAYDQVAALRIHSDRPVVCYGAVFRQSDNTPTALSAEDATVPAKTLYFPQLAEGGGWTTGIGIVNLNFTDSTLITFTAYRDDGTLFSDPGMTNPVTQLIPKGGFFHTTARTLFRFSGQSLQTGWLKVEASKPAINGYVEYGTATSHALVAAQLNASQLSMFSHQANASPYYTGLAVLNPGSLTTNVEVFSITDKGDISRKTQHVLKPGQKEALVLPYFWTPPAPDLPPNGGSVYVRSDKPVIATQLFGTSRALANVPPQQVTTVYSPRNDPGKLVPAPPLAVVETGKTQQFTAPGVTSPDWYVNGIKGGNDTVGTVTSSGTNTGVYRAPGKAPAPRTLTIQATSGSSSGGSSIDVVQREQLTGGLTLVTSVAYLESQNRFFVAEQKLLSSAPSVGYSAGANTSTISEVLPDKTIQPIQSIPNDTIAKMLPLVDSGSSYLILAGRDSGSIYRLEISSHTLTKVPVPGLIQPNSLALDPSSGNLLVADSGAGQIIVVSRSQILSASEPAGTIQSAAAPGRVATFSVPSVQGIAVDNCTGTVYASLADGTLHQYQGSVDRVVASGLVSPGQVLALYREGFSCSDALSLAIVEATAQIASRISLVYPNSQLPRTTLIDDLPSVLDITFFPKGNPFTAGGEASVGLAEPSPTAGQGQIAGVQVGGLYQSAPPVTIRGSALFSGTGPNEDPVGDTFDVAGLASQFGYSVPDIISVTGSVQGSSSVITIKFKGPVTLGALPTGTTTPGDGLWAFIFVKTTATATIQLPQGVNLASFFPFGDANLLTFDTWIGLYFGEATWVSFNQLAAGSVQVSAIGNTLTLSVPASALNLSGAYALVLVGNPAEFTDVAPNNGLMKLMP